MDDDNIHVQIGQVKIGHTGQFLHAILGSCIGLGFLCPARQIFGLAHCLLPKSQKTTDEIGARHVDQAIHSLQALMQLTKPDLRKLEVFLVGGANMTKPTDTDPKHLVGSINASFAYKALRELGMQNIHEDVGGVLGRKVTIDCTTGGYTVLSIPRLGKTS